MVKLNQNKNPSGRKDVPYRRPHGITGRVLMRTGCFTQLLGDCVNREPRVHILRQGVTVTCDCGCLAVFFVLLVCPFFLLVM